MTKAEKDLKMSELLASDRDVRKNEENSAAGLEIFLFHINREFRGELSERISFDAYLRETRTDRPRTTKTYREAVFDRKWSNTSAIVRAISSATRLFPALVGAV